MRGLVQTGRSVSLSVHGGGGGRGAYDAWASIARNLGLSVGGPIDLVWSVRVLWAVLWRQGVLAGGLSGRYSKVLQILGL